MDVCRICLNKNSNLEAIFKDERTTALDIFLITGVMIVEIHEKKAMICKNCLSSLSEAVKFRKSCRNSDHQLKTDFNIAESSLWKKLRDSMNQIYSDDNKVNPEFACEVMIKTEVDSDFDDYQDNNDEDLNMSDFNESDKECKNTFECSYCQKILKSKKTLRYHIQIFHKSESSDNVKCDICGKAFPYKHRLKRHIIEVHGKDFSKYIKKNDNNEENFNMPDFKELKNGCENSFECTYCQKILKSRKTLRYHIQVFHNSQIKCSVQCDICGKAFPYKQRLRRHIYQVHETVCSKFVKKNEADIVCEVCKVVLKNKKSYRGHLKAKHPDLMEEILFKFNESRKIVKISSGREKNKTGFWPCTICGKFFQNEGNLNQHEKTHKVLLPHEYFYCDLCGNKFKDKSTLKVHIRKRHIQKIRYQCDECTCSYTTNHALKLHIKVKHRNIREFVCNWCGKDFGAKYVLIAHERIHTGEQPYECKFCDAKFTHQTDYRRHKWNHEGRKDYKCSMCGEGFVRRSEQVAHENRCQVSKSGRYQNYLKQNHTNVF